MPAAKQPKKKVAPVARDKIVKLRPAKAKSTAPQGDGVAQFSLQQEMLQLLQRVSGNKSKRTATALVEHGPVRAFMVALDEGGR